MSASEEPSVIRNLSGYPTSRNYGDLWELAQRQSVVCIVDYEDDETPWSLAPGDPNTYRDVAQTIWIAEESIFRVSVRGCCYISGRSREGFCDSAERVNLEWIVPSDPDDLARRLEVLNGKRQMFEKMSYDLGGEELGSEDMATVRDFLARWFKSHNVEVVPEKQGGRHESS